MASSVHVSPQERWAAAAAPTVQIPSSGQGPVVSPRQTGNAHEEITLAQALAQALPATDKRRRPKHPSHRRARWPEHPEFDQVFSYTAAELNGFLTVREIQTRLDFYEAMLVEIASFRRALGQRGRRAYCPLCEHLLLGKTRAVVTERLDEQHADAETSHRYYVGRLQQLGFDTADRGLPVVAEQPRNSVAVVKSPFRCDVDEEEDLPF